MLQSDYPAEAVLANNFLQFPILYSGAHPGCSVALMDWNTDSGETGLLLVCYLRARKWCLALTSSRIWVAKRN